MYYRLNLIKREIITITSAALEEHTVQLDNDNFTQIYLSDMKLFLNNKIKLPNNSFLIVLNELYSPPLKKALSILIKEHTSIFIFLPILISANSSIYKQRQIQQLNEFIFSDEFKNIFSYTQPNDSLDTTIQ